MNNATSVADLFIGTSNALGNPFLIGNMLLVAFFFVFMAFLFSKEDIINVLVIDSFLTMILAVLLFSMGMVASYMIIAPMIMFVILIVLRLMT